MAERLFHHSPRTVLHTFRAVYPDESTAVTEDNARILAVMFAGLGKGMYSLETVEHTLHYLIETNPSHSQKQRLHALVKDNVREWYEDAHDRIGMMCLC